MKKNIIFLVGAPPYAPGLLYKMFLGQKNTELFFRPFTPHLDLIVSHLELCHSDLGLFPGYYETYSRYPHLLKDLKNILVNCSQIEKTTLVFEMSGYEERLKEFESLFPEAKVIGVSGVFNLKVCFEQKLWPLKEFHKDYIEVAANVLRFAGLEFIDTSHLCLNSDWLQLDYFFRDLKPATRNPSLAFGLERTFLKIYLDQKKALEELGRLENEVLSTRTLYENEKKASEERLRLVEELDSNLKEALRVQKKLMSHPVHHNIFSQFFNKFREVFRG